jgi:protein TonB
MSDRTVRSRTAVVAASCLAHLALVASLVLAEEWILSAQAPRTPVLPIELVTAAEPPAAEPSPAPPAPPPPPKIPPRRVPAVPPRPVRLPAPMETPLPAAIPSEPPAPAEARPDPPAPAEARPDPPRPAAPAPSPPPPTPIATAPSPPPAAPAPAGPPTVSSGAGRPQSAFGSGALAQATDPPAAGDGVPIGRPGPGPSGPAVASAPSRDTGATGAITRLARPQGGYQVRPGYPASARRLGIQGVTLLKVHVLADGRVGDVVVQETAGHPDLDQAATDAVRRWRFDPARRGEAPVAMWVLLPVEFRLR